MDRLRTQYHRLYLPHAAVVDTQSSDMLGPGAQVRALVLTLGGPPDWAKLAALWRGVQSDLGWPAPAIAVNGRDAFELWFSLAESRPSAEAAQLLAQLQLRYLADVHPVRVRTWPTLNMSAEPPACPPYAAAPLRWAAFIAPDLPAVFGDDPALDFQPGADAQAELLSRLVSITAADWQAALVLLLPPTAAGIAPMSVPAASLTHAPHANPPRVAMAGPYRDPRSFLLDVMNDATLDLALRVDVAKALLACGARC